jgi:glycerol-3-phosphate acyltransferase PlsX
MDDSQYGGAVLLGLNGIVVVAHGNSKANAIRHAIRVAKQGIEQNLLGKIGEVVKPTAASSSVNNLAGQLDDNSLSTVPT